MPADFLPENGYICLPERSDNSLDDGAEQRCFAATFPTMLEQTLARLRNGLQTGYRRLTSYCRYKLQQSRLVQSLQLVLCSILRKGIARYILSFGAFCRKRSRSCGADGSASTEEGGFERPQKKARLSASKVEVHAWPALSAVPANGTEAPSGTFPISPTQSKPGMHRSLPCK